MDTGLPRLEFEAHGRIASAVAKTRENRASYDKNQRNSAFQAPFYRPGRFKTDRLLALGITPFEFEGLRRQQIASSGFNAVRRRSGTTFEISNQQLAATQDESANFAAVLDLAPKHFEQIYLATLKPMFEFSFVGVDFEDIRATLSHRGSGGFAMASAHIDSVDRATQTALSEVSRQVGNLKQARGIVVVMESAKKTFRLRHVNEAMNVVKNHVDDDTYIIFSAHYDESLSDTFRISLIANGNIS